MMSLYRFLNLDPVPLALGLILAVVIVVGAMLWDLRREGERK